MTKTTARTELTSADTGETVTGQLLVGRRYRTWPLEPVADPRRPAVGLRRQLSTAAAEAVADRSLRLLLILFGMLQELDLVTTVVSHPGVREGNRLVAAVLRECGGFGFLLVKMAAVLVVVTCTGLLARLSRPLALWVLVGACLLFTSVVCGNLNLLLG
ncbi:MAG: hypothetical protein NVSMB29_03210 [Candidatus Dormibacteria bacterium]